MENRFINLVDEVKVCSLKDLYHTIRTNSEQWLHGHTKLWDYKIFETDNDNEKFIMKSLDAMHKAGGTIINYIQQLEPFRKEHIVSTFFLGLVLYDTLYESNQWGKAKIQTINDELDRLHITIDYNDKNDLYAYHKRFRYVWLLICLFHDLGYAIEDGKIEPENNVDISDILPSLHVPNFYTKGLVKQYKSYRENCMCKKDHGIHGGLFCYSHLQTLYEDRDVSYMSELAKLISSITMVHNIFFQTSATFAGKRCYPCFQLESLVQEKAREIKFEEHPLLFLFCLVDSIEPLKKGIKLEDVSLGITDEKLVIRVETQEKKDCQDKYVKAITSLDSWLTDVNVINDQNNQFEISLIQSSVKSGFLLSNDGKSPQMTENLLR